jgi:hypothetical protein
MGGIAGSMPGLGTTARRAVNAARSLSGVATVTVCGVVSVQYPPEPFLQPGRR